MWFILGACSSSPVPETPAATALINGKPAWLSSPQDYCGNQYWCAVGEGSGMMAAQTNARKNIALMLETSVKSKFQTTTTHQQQTTAQGIAGASEQEATAFIQEATEQTLQGVTIKEQFSDADACYALAMLDRRQAAAQIQEKIDDLDAQISSLYQTGKRSSFYQMLKLLPPRQALAEKVHTLSGHTVALPITIQEIQKQKRAYEAQRPAVQIDIAGGESVERDKKNIQHLVQQVMTENGYQGRRKQAVYQLHINWDARQEYLKVEGFVKYSYHLTLKSERLSDNTALGTLEINATASGRDVKDVWAQVEKELYQKLNEGFLALNLD